MMRSSTIGGPPVPNFCPHASVDRPFVSVIIVNYNGRHYLDDCLTSLRGLDYPPARHEVIVVDNASRDGSVEYLKANYPWVRVVAVKRNLGFAGGNNEGFRHARGDCIALLNNDTVVEKKWLTALVEEIESDPRLGAVGSKIFFKNDPGRINNTGLVLFADGSGADRGFRQIDVGQFEEAAEVFGTCGASTLYRRAMLADIGAFDEHFFMYYEDLDLCWRGLHRGWKFRYTPRSVVHHIHCGSSGEWSPFFLYHVERNRVFANWKNAPLRLALRVTASFGWRLLRKWFQVLTRRTTTTADWEHALAYARGGLSLFLAAPRLLGQRVWIRWVHRRVADRDWVQLVTPVSRAA